MGHESAGPSVSRLLLVILSVRVTCQHQLLAYPLRWFRLCALTSDETYGSRSTAESFTLASLQSRTPCCAGTTQQRSANATHLHSLVACGNHICENLACFQQQLTQQLKASICVLTSVQHHLQSGQVRCTVTHTLVAVSSGLCFRCWSMTASQSGLQL